MADALLRLCAHSKKLNTSESLINNDMITFSAPLISLSVLSSPPPSLHSQRFTAISTSRNSSTSTIPLTGSLRAASRPSNLSWPSMAADGAGEAVVLPRSVPVRVAYELLQAGHRYLDVRTVDEFNAGHAKGATNVAYMLKIGSGMVKNPHFMDEVSSAFGKDDEIIIGCQTGKRSLMAAAELLYAGFTGITDIAGGYSTWTQNALPTD